MKQTRNSIMRGARGALGNELVFRQRNGKTVISLPASPREDNPSPKQLQGRSKFKDAFVYARKVLADPVLKDRYQRSPRLGATVYNTAISDAMKGPEILGIEWSGDTICIRAVDNFEVRNVWVCIINAGGDVIEEGGAVMRDGDLWVYVFSVGDVFPAGGMVKVVVSDWPGNLVVGRWGSDDFKKSNGRTLKSNWYGYNDVIKRGMTIFLM